MAKINKAMTLFLLLASDETFEAFMMWLREEGREYWADYYSPIREKWGKKVDSRGVIEIPLEEINPQVLRALTCFSCEACDAAEDICDGETGVFLPMCIPWHTSLVLRSKMVGGLKTHLRAWRWSKVGRWNFHLGQWRGIT
jgi:hypothetical protein